MGGAADLGSTAMMLFNVLVGTGLFGLPRLVSLAGAALSSGFLAVVRLPWARLAWGADILEFSPAR